MGKSKRRILSRAKNDKNLFKLTREEAIKIVFGEITKNTASIEAKNIISLFGLTAEELAEAGISYEVLRSLDGLIS